ncbi:hypothetical protein [Micromonospora siamensis]|uniref:Uncharacterized protein n=1 Tax=Micromonospora siamensis TaxID=299152 RepID=A0A1C5HYN8_9ACTN|nr:hypothetical protein [Micromonospora siamensis]SCG51144.1 hypothetical protein GA0074704_2597 [Micromonospora siamensis]
MLPVALTGPLWWVARWAWRLLTSLALAVVFSTGAVPLSTGSGPSAALGPGPADPASTPLTATPARLWPASGPLGATAAGLPPASGPLGVMPVRATSAGLATTDRPGAALREVATGSDAPRGDVTPAYLPPVTDGSPVGSAPAGPTTEAGSRSVPAGRPVAATGPRAPPVA